eukprot:scaffold398674_cov38-Prasinocladus_malaysianus.AAC.2
MAVDGLRDRPAATSLGLHYQPLGQAPEAFRLGLESDAAPGNIPPQGWSEVQLRDVQQHWDDRSLDLNSLGNRDPGVGVSILGNSAVSDRWSPAWAVGEGERLEAADSAGTRGGSQLEPAFRYASATFSGDVRSTWDGNAKHAACQPTSSQAHGSVYGGLPISFEPTLGHGLHQGRAGHHQFVAPLNFTGQEFQGLTFSSVHQQQGHIGKNTGKHRLLPVPN